MEADDLTLETLASLRPDLAAALRDEGFSAGYGKGLRDSLCMTGEAVRARLAELERHGRRHVCHCAMESDPEPA